MTTLRRLLIRLTIVIVIVVIAGTGFGYSQLQVQRSGSLSITPALKTDIGSIGSAIFSVFSGDLGAAAESVIEGVRFKGTVEVANESFVPVFIPKLEHHVFVQQVATYTTFDTPSRFLAPGASAEFEFDFIVPVDGLAQVALNIILDGGDLRLNIDSALGVGPLSVTNRAEFVESIPSVRDLLLGL
jgi:hypothetical protein